MARLVGYIPPIHTENLPPEERKHEEVKLSSEYCAEADEGAEPDGGTKEPPAHKKTARKKQSE